MANASAIGLSWPRVLLGGELAFYSLLALSCGLKSGFLVRQSVGVGPLTLGLDALRRLIAPALLEAVPNDRWLL
ncbi:MAG: hypothetical protein WBA99_14460 [Nodosilinea sp.]